MSANKHAQSSGGESVKKYQVHNSLVSYYLLAMFSIFPLFLTNQYANSRHDKYYFFLFLSGAMAIASLISYGISRHEEKLTGTPKPFLKPVSAADIAVLCFFVCAVISSLASPYFVETLNADSARNNGLILLFTYTLVYLCLSRMYVYKDYVIAVYLVFSCIVALLTVINFFYIDPIGIFDGYTEDVATDFGSTIGNKNTIAAFMSLFTPAAIMVSVVSEKSWMRILGRVSLCFAYMAALCANSGSVLLGLAVAIPLMAAISARSRLYLRRFFLAMTILFASGWLLRLFSLIMGDRQKGFEFIQNFLIYDPRTLIPLAFCAVLTLLLYFLPEGRIPYPSRALPVILFTLTVIGVLGLIGTMVYFTEVDTATELGSFDRLLRFDDRWGTHRGFMWIRSLEEYGKYDFFKMLFGAGPDMTIKVLEPHFAELYSRFGDGYTDCAHNEYINYLITQGALGLLSYLMILGTVCVRALRRAKSNPMGLVFVSAVLCCAIQATVNLYTPITTPILILFLSMTEGMNRLTPLNKENA